MNMNILDMEGLVYFVKKNENVFGKICKTLGHYQTIFLTSMVFGNKKTIKTKYYEENKNWQRHTGVLGS